MNMSILDLFMWQILRGLAWVPAMFLNHPESLKWSPFDTVDPRNPDDYLGCIKPCKQGYRLYIYIYINYWIILHCRKLTARFFVKLVASRKTSLSFFIPFSNAEVSPRSFREGKYPPVNWISYNFVDRPVFSEKTLPKFFTASTRPWKVTIWGPPIGSRIIVFLSHHFARANR